MPLETLNPPPSFRFSDFEGKIASMPPDVVTTLERMREFDEVERQQKRLTDWERMLGDGFDQVATERGFRDRFERAAAVVPRNELQRKLARDLFVQDITGASPDQLRSGVPQLQVAKKLFNLTDPSDEAFDKAMHDSVADQVDTRDRQDQAAQAARYATIQGRPAAEVAAIAQAKAGDKWKEIEPVVRGEQAHITASYSSEELEAARDLFQTAAKIEGAKVEQVTKPESFVGFLAYGKADQATRERMMNLVALQAQAEGQKVETFLNAMDANLQDLAAGIFAGNSRRDAAALRKVASSGVMPDGATVADGADALYSRLFVTRGGKVLPNGEVAAAKTREMTQEEQQQLLDLADLAEGASAFMSDLKSAGVRVRPFIDEETKGFWRRATLNAANSLPSMVIAAAPGGIGMVTLGASYGERNLSQVRSQGGTITPATEIASMASGMMEAGIDRLEWLTLGAKLPRLTASILQLGKPGALMVLGGRWAGVGVMETGQEVVQDMTFPVVQQLTSAFSKDMPGPDWQGILINEYEALGDIFGASLVLGAIGGTGSTAVEYFNRDKVREVLRDKVGLRLAGYPQGTVDAIADLAEKNTAAAAELLKAAQMETPVEQRKTNSASFRAQLEQAAKDMPTAEEAFIPTIEKRDDGGYQVRYPDGRVDSAESEMDAIEAVRMWEDEDLNRMDIANRALARELERSHADNPEIAASFKFTGKDVSMETWANESAANVEKARQRVRIAMRDEFVSGMSETDGSEIADADLPLGAFLVLGSSQNFGGAVTRIAAEINKQGNVATVLEEHAEGVVKWLMDTGKYSRADVIRGIRETEAATGKQTLADDLDSLGEDASRQAIVEAFSRLAVANAFGKVPESSLSAKFKALFRAIKEAFSAVLSLAGQIREIQLAGQMDEQFEYWLDVAGGVSERYQMENLQKAAERELQDAAMEGFPEIASTLKGKLPRHETLRQQGSAFAGEVERLYDGLRNSSANGASPAARTRVANEFFLPVGEMAAGSRPSASANRPGFPESSMNLFAAFGSWFTGWNRDRLPWPKRKEDLPPMMTPADIGPLTVSPNSLELIIAAEVSSASYYEKKLSRPTWPGGDSGITIGIGYDVGYNTPAQIRKDWGDVGLPVAHLDSLIKVAGMKGSRAENLVDDLRHVSIPWLSATAVFQNSTLPRFARLTAETFPGVEKLHPHIQGALLSIVFNRGSSLHGDRRREMRAIRDHIAAGHPEKIPAELRRMKRLWQGQGLDGLLKRREDEALLVELGLAS